MNSGIMPNSIRSSLVTCAEQIRPDARSRCSRVAAEADGLAADAAGNDVVEADERAAADEQDVAWCPPGCIAARDACGLPGAERC